VAEDVADLPSQCEETRKMSEKRWNHEKQMWEIDGQPCEGPVWQVTWRWDGGEQASRAFPNVDQGYSYYQMMQKDPRAFNVRWIPG
jgi:hypothetical protein